MSSSKVSQAKLKVSAEGGGAAAKQLDQVGKATQRVGKEQTRLGQASASAGRQFSAQAQGLGGIVSAYAGAAANVFAITAAFFALRRAAEFSQIVAGTDALASSIGANGQDIVNSVQNITKSQLSLLDTVQQVNLALVSGFNTTQIEQLSDVSLRASKALGRNLADAFQRIVRGAAKLEPELLDELGIFTRIDPAVRKYADSIGVSVSSLTNFERRQAFVNAVIEEGNNKYRDVNVTSRTAAESLQTLASRVVDTGLKFGAALASGIAPFADFISDKASNVLALFGVLARVVGAQALAVLDAGIVKTSAAIANFGQIAALAANNFSIAFRTAAKEAATIAAAGVNFTRFGTQAEVASKRAAAAVLSQVAANKVLTISETKKAIATLESAIAAEKEFIARSKSTTNIAAANASIATLTANITALNAQQKAGVVGANLFATGLTKLASAASFAGAAVSRVFGFVTFAITALSIFQLVADGLLRVFGFDLVDVFEPIVGFFKDFIGNLNKGKVGVEGLAASVQSDLLGATASFGALGRTAEKAIEAATDALADYSRFLAGTGVLDKALTNLIEFQKLKDEASAAGAALRVLLAEIERLGGANIQENIRGLLGVEILSQQTGVAAQKLIALVQKTRGEAGKGVFGLTLGEAGALSVIIDGIATQITEIGENGEVKLVKGFEKAGGILSAFAEKNAQFASDFEKGLLTAERAAAAIGAQTNIIAQLEEEATTQRRLGNVAIAETLEALAGQLAIQRNINQGLAQNIADAEKLSKVFEKVFGKPGEKLGLLAEQGAIFDVGGGNISFALTAREKLANQAERLSKRIQEANTAEQSLNNRLPGYLEARETVTDQIAKDSALLKDQTLSLQDQQEISARLEDNRKVLAEFDKQIGDVNSTLLDQLEQRLLDEQALVFIRQQLESSLEKELETLQKLERTLKTEILATENKIADIRGNRQLNILKNQLALLKQINGFNEKIASYTGDSEAAKLFSAVSEGRINVEIAQKESTETINRAERQYNLDILKLENDKKQFEYENKVRMTNINATIKLIRALNKNAEAINDQINQAGGGTRDPGTIDITGLTFAATELERLGESIFKLSQDVFEKRKTLLGEEFALTAEKATQGLEQAEKAAVLRLALEKFEQNERVKIFKGVNQVITTELSNSINAFFDAIAQGTITLQSFKEGFKDFLFNILDGIRKAVLEETLIKPIQQEATKFLAGAFGLPGLAKRSIDDAVIAIGGTSAVNVNVINADGENPISEAIKGVSEKSGGFIEELINKLKGGFSNFGNFVSSLFTNLGSSVSNIFSGIISGIGNIGSGVGSGFGSIFSSIISMFSGGSVGLPLSSIQTAQSFSPSLGSSLTSLFGFATGGLVQRYANGGSVMAQDRVPALLQPGEFVMKKSAVNSMGVNNMAMMNATGKGAGNVVVNIKNEGTPQDAQASPPRFDGEKFVIDIVTRDLRNNGPIRKSLRGGAA